MQAHWAIPLELYTDSTQPLTSYIYEAMLPLLSLAMTRPLRDNYMCVYVAYTQFIPPKLILS